MIRNYFKIAWRNLQRNKLYSFINIAGLSVGITCCVFIFLYVQNELSYDHFNANANHIYRLTEILHLPKEDNARAVSSPPMARAIQSNFPEVKRTVRINPSGRILSHDETKIYDTRIIYADSTLFDIFTFPMVKGNPKKALVNPYSIVLTERAAKKYFGQQDALGKTMQLSDTINLTVTGIIKDVPANSHFTFDCVLSHATMNQVAGDDLEDIWFYNGFYTYVLLSEKSDYKQLETKITDLIATKMTDARKETGLSYDLKLQPLTDIHLKSNLNSEISPNGNLTYVYIFSAAAFLILLIGCSNFINLSTAKSINRAKEIGLRKVIGARRFHLTLQFLGESFFLVFISSLLSVALLQLLSGYFNSLTGQLLSLSIFSDLKVLLLYAGIILFVSLSAGIYPAFLMSGFSPVKVFKGTVKHSWEDVFLRKGLVVFQFSIAVILIVASVMVFQQLRFVQNKNLGLNKEQLVEIELPRIDSLKMESLMTLLRKNPNVLSACLTDFSFKEQPSRIAMVPEGSSENEVTSECVVSVDEDFLNTFQIELLAGRDFSKGFSTDLQNSFIVNETAVKSFDWKTPEEALGKNIVWDNEKKGKVIGVVKDFNFASLHDNVQPLIIHILPDWYGYIAVRLQPDNLPETLSNLERQWKSYVNSPFTYSFLDEDFSALYKGEQNLQRILSLFTMLSIFIACLGLFGLTAAMVKQRYKEIGIRKVLGASIMNVIGLLSKDFLKLVLIASVIAFPIVWIWMNKWLQGYAYRIDINWWIFGIAAVASLVIALMTVSLQAIGAATTNPIKSLRTE